MDTKALEKLRKENQTVPRQWRGEFIAANEDTLRTAAESAGWRVQQVNPLVNDRFVMVYWATESNCVLPFAKDSRQKWVQRFNQPGESDEAIDCNYTEE